jgi:hypothetical protein
MQTPLSLYSARYGVLLLALSGCPGTELPPLGESSTGVDEPMTTTFTPVCTPGQQETCPCPGGVDGTQVCAADGTTFEPCQCEPTEDSTGTGPDTTTTTSSTGSTGSTGLDTSTTGTTDSTSTETTDGSPLVCDEYVPPPGLECDLWLQDCPAGEKCIAWSDDGTSSWNSVRCSPIDPALDQVGDSCTVEGSGTSGIDSCDIGAMCWAVDSDTNIGTCVALCTGCPEEPICDEAGTTCTITNDGIITLCLPGCDPLTQDCVAGQACYPVGDSFLCAPDASGAGGAYGDPCAFINVCDPGLFCLGTASVPPGEACQGAAGCCTEACDLLDPLGDAQCTGAPGGQVCTPWYAMGMAPVGYDDVGVCSLP